MWRLREALEDAGGTHTSADAHGYHAVAGVLALEVADQGGGEFGSGAAERMAEGDCAAVGIDTRGVEAGLLDYGKGLRGEGFVELDYGDVAEREAGELQRFGNGENGTDAEFFRRAAGGRVGDKTRERFEAEGVSAGLAHDHRSGGAVAHGRAVSGGDGALCVEGGL